LVNDHLARLTVLEAPEEVLQCFRDWVELAKELLEPTAMPMPGMPPAAGAVPQIDPSTGMPLSPAGDASMGPMGQPMEPGPMVEGPGGMPINDITGAPAPSVSTPAANAFLGQ
jgi:hypothetical protein